MAIIPEPQPTSQEYALQYITEGSRNQPLTDLSFLGVDAEWPPPSQAQRIRRYTTNKLLWDGLHEEVYLDNWHRVMDKQTRDSFELVFNWHKRLSTLWADLLLSEQPRFLDGTDEEEDPEASDAPDENPPRSSGSPQIAGDAYSPAAESSENDPLNPAPPRTLPSQPSPSARARQDAIDRIVKKDDHGYVSTLYEVALDISRFGDGVAKVTLDAEDGAEIWATSPEYWFPVVAPDNLRKYTAHVLAHPIDKGELGCYLYAEIHTKGHVSRRVFKLEGNRVSYPVGLEQFSAHPAEEPTGLNDFLVVPFHGLRTSDQIFGTDDYCDVDSIVAAIEKRAGQINKILDKHSDPSMYGPPDALGEDETGDAAFRVGSRYFPVDSEQGEDPPGYVVWEPHMEAQFLEMDTLIKQLYVISETSPAAFGQMEAGLVESGSALRRLMQAPLAKVARISMRFDPSARLAVQIAADLEHFHNGGPKIDRVQAQWQDGLPPDPREQAETEKMRLDAGNTSLVSAIIRLDGGTEEEAEAEIRKIEEEGQRKSHADIQAMKAEGALELQKIEAQANARPASTPAA